MLQKNLFCFTVILLYCIQFAYPQNISVSGTVLDSLKQKPLYPANVVVSNKYSGLYLKGTITNAYGEFYLDRLTGSDYTITISYVGYKSKSFSVSPSEIHSLNIGNIYLAVSPVEIQEVEVIYKPLIEYDDDGNVTLNIDMMGNVEDLSVADVIETIPGLYFDFDGNLHFKGYSGFTTLIDGKWLGGTYSAMSVSGNREQYKLKQIPAKYIKSVEILPEPRGKYGFYTPVINIVPKGDLRNFYDATAEGGIKNKYGMGVGVSKMIKKLTITPSFELKHPAQYHTGEEIRDYQNMATGSYTEESTASMTGKEGKITVASSYKFENTHVLSLNASTGFSDNRNSIFRNIEQNGGISQVYHDLTESEPKSNELSLNYRRRFNLGLKRNLYMTFNASYNNYNENGQQEFLNHSSETIEKKYWSDLNRKNSKTNVVLNYNNSRYNTKYSVKANISIQDLVEKSNRDFYESVTQYWETIPMFTQNIKLKKFTPDLTLKCNRKFESLKGKNKITYVFYASVTERLNLEKIEDLIQKTESNVSRLKTNWAFSNRNHINTYIILMSSYNGNILWPDSKQLVEAPQYIDEFTIKKGNPNLKPEVSHHVNIQLCWNPTGILILTPKSSKDSKPPRTGYSIGLDYRSAGNKIVQTHSVDESGLLTYSYGNSESYRSFSADGNFRWIISPFVKIEFGGNYDLDQYSEVNDSEYSSSWSANSRIQLKLLRKINFEAKYRYNSPKVFYQRKVFSYHDANISFSTFAFKNTILFSLEASNLLAKSGRKVEFYGDGFKTTTLKYLESPIIWFHMSLKLFQFYKKE